MTQSAASPLSDATPLDPLTARRAHTLDLDPATFRALGHDLVDRIADFLGAIAERRVAPGKTPTQVRAILGARRGIPSHGEDPARVLANATDLVLANSTLNGHPRFFGYITSSAAPIGALADLLAAAVNPNMGAWALSPIATEIELQSIRWIAELLGFPTTCGGILVSGGNMANMVCALAAIRAKAPWDVRAEGLSGGPPLAIYASAETHTWLDKAADLSGLGDRVVRRVEVDPKGRLRPDALRRAIIADRDAGIIPAFVVGTAGTVSTGVIDPLVELGALCREENVWFHVDGAYGAPVAALPDAPADLAALADADSIAVDPHKWLYAPMEAGCALVRDPEALHRAYRHRPPYYRFDGIEEDPPVNFHEWGPQNSRGFRALKVWLGLRQAGREGVCRSIADDMALTRRLRAHVTAHPELEAVTCELSITTFRYVPLDLRDRAYADPGVASYLNDLNTAILSASQDAGDVFVSNAVIGGRFLLRACIVNFRTTEADVAAIPELIARVGRVEDARLRNR